jgi:hypothetical protein
MSYLAIVTDTFGRYRRDVWADSLKEAQTRLRWMHPGATFVVYAR